MAESENKPSVLFVSAMFRSGSTFIARLLNAHREIVCASDPMRPVFNSLRYDIADRDYRTQNARFDPIEDYFLSNDRLFQRVLSSDLDLKIEYDPSLLLSVIAQRAKPYSGLFSDLIDVEANLDTYQDCIAYLLARILEAYGKNKSPRYIGFKEVWSNEFFAPIKASWPDAKAIFIIRDPRAIVASNNSSGAPYPTFFMGRQWRKLAMIARRMEKEMPGTIVLKYEDIVTHPTIVFDRVSNFLGLERSLGEINFEALTDGRGLKWFQNTNYTRTTGPENSATRERWRSRISEAEIRTIEFLCCDWMEEFGYVLDNERSKLESFCSADYTGRKRSELAGWIRPFSFDDDLEKVRQAVAQERHRLRLPHNASEQEKWKYHRC